MILGEQQLRDRLDAGDITITPNPTDRLTPRGCELRASTDVYRFVDIGRPVNPLAQETLERSLQRDEMESGEILLEPFEPIVIRSRESIGVDPSLRPLVSSAPSLGNLGIFSTWTEGQLDGGSSIEEPRQLSVTLLSTNPNPVVLHPGQLIGHLTFMQRDVGSPATQEEHLSVGRWSDFEDFPTSLVEDELVIGVTGLAGTGKSVVAEMLAELLGAQTHGMGEIVREATRERGLEETSDNLNQVSKSLREEHGDGAVAEQLVAGLQDEDSTTIRIIEGIRSPAEIAVFREKLTDSFCMIGVHSSMETRIDRITDRGRSDDAGGKETLLARDEKETGFGIREAITRCDHIITNEGSLDALQREVERAIARLLAEQA